MKDVPLHHVHGYLLLTAPYCHGNACLRSFQPGFLRYAELTLSYETNEAEHMLEMAVELLKGSELYQTISNCISLSLSLLEGEEEQCGADIL